MKKIAVLFFWFMSISALAANVNSDCIINECSAGTKAITYASKSEMYFACPTLELSDYTNFVIGLVSASFNLTGRMPNISPLTGEPEYLDSPGKPNQTRIFLDHLRNSANVRTFDQAVELCIKGKNKVHVSVMNNPKDSVSIWVQNDKTKETFWMPKGMLNKQK